MLRIVGAIVLAAAVARAVEPQAFDPVADPAAVVTASDKRARFTVLTDCLVRSEYAVTAGQFEDRATLAFINRKQAVPKFSSSESAGTLTITTGCVTVEYKLNSASFDGALTISSAASSSPKFAWTPADGLVAPGNLLGTIRSLDDIHTIDLNCEPRGRCRSRRAAPASPTGPPCFHAPPRRRHRQRRREDPRREPPLRVVALQP